VSPFVDGASGRSRRRIGMMSSAAIFVEHLRQMSGRMSREPQRRSMTNTQ
jgi:hypothetical protein